MHLCSAPLPAARADRSPALCGSSLSARRLFAVVIVAVAAIAGNAGAAEAGQEHRFGKWRVSITASITHDWNSTTSFPCGEVGSGQVTATMKARSRVFRLAYFSRGGYKHWSAYPDRMLTTGQITASDRTSQNPPDEHETCTPTDKSQCVTRSLARTGADAVLRGLNTRGTPGVAFDAPNLQNVLLEGDGRPCQNGDFDFSGFPGAPKRHHGQLFVKMPRASRIRRRPFTVVAVDRSSAKEGWGTTRTMRKVSLRFKPHR